MRWFCHWIFFSAPKLFRNNTKLFACNFMNCRLFTFDRCLQLLCINQRMVLCFLFIFWRDETIHKCYRQYKPVQSARLVLNPMPIDMSMNFRTFCFDFTNKQSLEQNKSELSLFYRLRTLVSTNFSQIEIKLDAVNRMAPFTCS